MELKVKKIEKNKWKSIKILILIKIYGIKTPSS
jgi:hypothetical protein